MHVLDLVRFSRDESAPLIWNAMGFRPGNIFGTLTENLSPRMLLAGRKRASKVVLLPDRQGLWPEVQVSLAFTVKRLVVVRGEPGGPAQGLVGVRFAGQIVGAGLGSTKTPQALKAPLPFVGCGEGETDDATGIANIESPANKDETGDPLEPPFKTVWIQTRTPTGQVAYQFAHFTGLLGHP